MEDDVPVAALVPVRREKYEGYNLSLFSERNHGLVLQKRRRPAMKEIFIENWSPDWLEELDDVGDVSEVGCVGKRGAGTERSDESTSFTEVADEQKQRCR